MVAVLVGYGLRQRLLISKKLFEFFITQFVMIKMCAQEIGDNPALFVEGASRFDIVQGQLGKLPHFNHCVSVFVELLACLM